jgi:hypothetical protein
LPFGFSRSIKSFAHIVKIVKMKETNTKALNIYVIYEDPLDHPGMYVLRRWVGLVPDPKPLVVTAVLEEVRAALPDYCIPIGRYPEDDPKIKEVWI